MAGFGDMRVRRERERTEVGGEQRDGASAHRSLEPLFSLLN
jgi:hypothetical protein